MQTPYGVLSYQTPTSRNCKLLRTQLYSLLLAVHEAQGLQDKTNILPMGTHLKLQATHL